MNKPNHNYIEELEKKVLLLESQAKHLTNDLRITREENEASTRNFFDIYSKMEKKVEERTAELTEANIKLNEEIEERKRVEVTLQEANEELEKRVEDRTAHIAKVNEGLRAEIAERNRAETELQMSKEAAEAANRSKSQFLANMSHEVRTPLNHIIGFTELILDKNFGELNDVQEEYLTDVYQSSEHLLSLINDILDLSNVEAGYLEFEPSKVDVRGVLENSLVMVKEKALKHGIQIQLSTNFDNTSGTIVADERKFKQILYNLLSNAVKFTPDGGSITLTACHLTAANDHLITQDGRKVTPTITNSTSPMTHKNFIEISVADTGIGIKNEDLVRIFDPFEQVDGSVNRSYQGAGLGLSLTKRLVELHGGQIWAESEGESKGATFSFIIPF